MSLASGTRLGSYEIVAPIGAGGMGEVYRAKDTRLDRDVAIKVLPESFALDADRVARFTREAQVLASLNHPNIAAIYGIEEQGSTRALVMELVEGEDLSAHIARGAIPLAESLPIAKQIAEALEAAHEQGIIHRDLKPQNIKVRADGTVKVLDFGLAKAIDASGLSGGNAMNSPTLTARATQLGMIIGTAAYMSPEQARGRAVDKRADIWAFGAVLYEMLTGARAFKGDDVSDTLASVLKDTPDLAAMPSTTPMRLRNLVQRCLERDIKMRLRDIGEARVELARIESGAPATGVVTETADESTVAAPRGRSWQGGRSRTLMAIGGLIVAGLALLSPGTAWMRRMLSPEPSVNAGVTQVSVTLPPGDEISESNRRPLAIATDGRRLVYAGQRDGKSQLFVRELDDRTPRSIDGTDGAGAPFFSPDGQWVGFFAAGKLRKVAANGAGVTSLADAPANRGGVWAPDGFIYYAPANSGGIWRVPENGGAAAEVFAQDASRGEISLRWPSFVVDGTLLFGVWTGPGNDEHNVAVQKIGGERHFLVKGGDAPAYAPGPGLLAYSRLGEVFVVSWRPGQTDFGKAVPMPSKEHTNDTRGAEGAGNFALSADGTFAFLPGGRTRNGCRLVWVDRLGRTEAVPGPDRDFENATLSPDGTRAAVQIREAMTSQWIYDTARSTLVPTATNSGSDQSAVWTPDGTRLIYRGTRAGQRNLYVRPVDGSMPEARLTAKPGVTQGPSSVSPDGMWLVFNEASAKEIGGSGVWMMRLAGDRTPKRAFDPPGGEAGAQVSPDGKWMAFYAPVGPRTEVFVTSFPVTGARRQISTDGGAEPLWSRDGHELYYQNRTKFMVSTVTIGAAFSASVPRTLYEGSFLPTVNGNTPYSVSKDGTRFLRVQQIDPDNALTRIDLVFNWFATLKPLGSGK
jgi:Tol biopolymer transport system component